MTPYYDEDGITIYHGDCAELLNGFPGPGIPDLVLTDPPYGIKWDNPSLSGNLQDKLRPPKSTLRGKAVAGDDRPFNPKPLLDYPRVILWGANHYADRLPVGGWIVWDKTGGGKARTFMADAELAWHNLGRGVDVFHHLWLGTFRDSEIRVPRVHPAQKPVSLMRWILEKWSEPDDLILDPYMGTGPIAQACKEMGREYIGIEIEERYCEIAVQRLAQGVLDFA